MRGGGAFDRVLVNEHAVYVRMYVSKGSMYGLAIMNDNDILQTKYVVDIYDGISLFSTSIDDLLHIVIKNVTKHMGTTYNDAQMMTETTTVTINDDFDSRSYGTWTSTIVPENVTVELNCEVVDNSSIITTKCDSDNYWPDSVFNRIPILVAGGAKFGYGSRTNHAVFGTNAFSIDGSVPGGWNKYNVTGSGSNLTIGGQFTIMGLPESFVSHWVDTIHAKAYMGNDYAMFVPPDA